MSHARGFAKIAKALEAKARADHPGVKIKWSMPIIRNKNGSAGGRMQVQAKGFNPATYYLFINDKGDWHSNPVRGLH